MITRLQSALGERVYDAEIGRFVEAIPCHRCGVCCERWQPLVSEAEVERLSAYLGVTVGEFLERYTTLYPLNDAVRLLRQEGAGCVFLRHDEDGRSACAVHPARPDACSGWTASFARRECVDGLRRFGEPGNVVPLAALYPEAEERRVIAGIVAGTGAEHGG